MRPKRILVVELWNIGDVVLTLPFLTQLRVLFPDAKITLMAQSFASEILSDTGLIDDFIETNLAWKFAGAGKYNLFRYPWREIVRVFREIRGRNFDLAFSSRSHIRERVLLALSGAAAKVRNEEPIGRHKVEEWMALIQLSRRPLELATPPLQVSTIEQQWASEFLESYGMLTDIRVIGIHPGASVPVKRWPLEKFAEVAHMLAQEPGLRVIAFVEPGGYGAALGTVKGVTTARVSLPRLMALIDRCTVFVGNDSGPMHIAAALGVPVIALFEKGVDRWFSPLGEGHEIIPLESSEPAQVVEAVKQRLHSAPPSDRPSRSTPQKIL